MCYSRPIFESEHNMTEIADNNISDEENDRDHSQLILRRDNNIRIFESSGNRVVNRSEIRNNNFAWESENLVRFNNEENKVQILNDNLPNFGQNIRDENSASERSK